MENVISLTLANTPVTLKMGKGHQDWHEQVKLKDIIISKSFKDTTESETTCKKIPLSSRFCKVQALKQ